MAELFTSTIPNLIQGVSQQPDAQRDPTQAELQINGVSSSAEGLRKRDPTQTLAMVSSTSLGDVFVHAILRDRNERYLAVISSSTVTVFDLNGVAQTVNAPSGYSYLSGVTDAKRQIRCGTVADYTFVASSLQVVAMDSAVAPAVARPAAHEALVWVKAANYGQSYRVNVNGTLATVTTTTTAGTAISTADIAEQIKTGLAGVTGVSITRVGSVLHLTSAAVITISATDARANADITAITNSVQSFTNLPTIAPAGYQVEVMGDPTNAFDGYYVKFEPRAGAGTFGEGAWEETVAPGAKYKLNPATMPHVLVRLPAGTWYFGPLNGAALTGLTLPTWGQRVAGDSETAPDPSFVGQSVNDIFVHRGRLGILADEKRIYSRAKDFFAFFPETVTTVLDSDPIDKTASSSKVSVLRYAVPFQGEMLLFSDDYQFRSYATDAALTPATDAITILTSYEIDPGVRPIQMGGSVVFCQANGEWSQLRQFSVRGAGTALVGDAESISEHVSSYIPSGIFQLAANDTGNALYCISSKAGYTNRIYTYKYFYRNGGNGIERAQSSWSHWELPGATSILSIVAIQETLYLLVQRCGGVFLEKMPVLDRQSVAAAPYPLLLDRWVSTGTASPAGVRVPAGVYNPVTKLTTWTLPFTICARTEAWSAYQPEPVTAQGTPGPALTIFNPAPSKIIENYDEGAYLGFVVQVSDLFNITVTELGTWNDNPTADFSRFVGLYEVYAGGLPVLRASTTIFRSGATTNYQYENGFCWAPITPVAHTGTWNNGSNSPNPNNPISSLLVISWLETGSNYLSGLQGPPLVPPDYDGGEGIIFRFRYASYPPLPPAALASGGGGNTSPWDNGPGYIGPNFKYSIPTVDPARQGGVLLGSASSGNTITARGNWSTAQVYFGETYNFRYRPSRFKPMRTQGGGQVTSNTLRAQIRQAQLRYHETGFFQVRVTPSGNRDEAVYSFPGSTISLLQGADEGQAGVFRIPVFGRGESNTITIENDTPHPCKFASLEWTGLITGKGRAVQQ